MRALDSRFVYVGEPPEADYSPPEEVSKDMIDAYFAISKEHSEDMAKCLGLLTQFEIDQLIHEHASKDEAYPGLRGEIKSAILSGDKDELTVLGSIATQQAMRGAELKALRGAAKARMEDSAKKSFHKSGRAWRIKPEDIVQ